MYKVNGMYFETLREAIDDAKWLLSGNSLVYIQKDYKTFMCVTHVKDGKFLVEKVR